jgi:hypothetical protein
VVRYLLERGIDLGERHRGETGLHWAAYSGNLQIVKLLVARGSPLEVKDETWANTPLGWALHGWEYPSPEFKRPRHAEVVKVLVGAGARIESRWRKKLRTLRDRRRFGSGITGKQKS